MKPEGTLARLAKAWGVTQPVTAPDEALSALQTKFNTFRAEAEANLAEVTTALEAAVNTIKEVEAEKAALAESLAALQSAQAEAEAKAAEAKAKARKDKIEAVLGTERADAVFAATASMSDEGFSAVLNAMTVAAKTESESPLFTEQGAGAEANAEVADQPSKEMQILRAKYTK